MVVIPIGLLWPISELSYPVTAMFFELWRWITRSKQKVPLPCWAVM